MTIALNQPVVNNHGDPVSTLATAIPTLTAGCFLIALLGTRAAPHTNLTTNAVGATVAQIGTGGTSDTFVTAYQITGYAASATTKTVVMPATQSGNGIAISVYEISGAGANPTIDAAWATASSTTAATGTAPTLALATAGDMVFSMFVSQSTWGTPAGAPTPTEDYAEADVKLMTCRQLCATTTYTPASSATVAGLWVAGTFAIRPAPPIYGAVNHILFQQPAGAFI